jgi:hypothetical protein
MCAAMIFLSGCTSTPTAKDMVSIEESTLQERQMQTRSFDTANESVIFSSSVATLQDLGFNIDEIDRNFGLITCSKTRDAREVGAQVGNFFLGLAGALVGIHVGDNTDNMQTILVTVVTTPKEIQDKTNVRINIKRIIRNKQGYIKTIETVSEPSIYDEFFGRLSKAVFLEASNI